MNFFSTRLADYSPDSDFYHVDPEIKTTEDHQAFFKEFVEQYLQSFTDNDNLEEYFSPENLDNIDREERREYSYEQANSYIDIYNGELREKAYNFSDRIEDALSDYGRDPKKSTLINLFQMGQGMFYERLLQYGLDDLKQFLEDEKENKLKESE